MAKKPSRSGQIRIIGGQWRSRRLPIHDLEGLRPTTDRVRETLFNWLANDLPGARVLDCFSGSGALGLEALSRYAEHALMLELQANAAKQLTQNLLTLQCDRAKVVKGDTLKLLAQPPQQGFDIVFVDPPFNKELAEPCLQLLLEHNWLNNNALIYLETEVNWPLKGIPSHWHLLKEKKAGQVCFRLFQHHQNTEER